MSASNVITEAANNKVLPGDKTGLPWELWQIILSWLSGADLCRVSCVCKTWAELVASVDSTRWKELYLSCSEWHHPFWPLNTQTEPPSWRFAYRDQHISTRFWCQRHKRDAKNVTCSLLFKKNVLQKSIHVGPGLEHETLCAALSVANGYDRIVMHPGIYDEQGGIMSKVPFELIGCGELGSVILNVGIKQLSISTRLSSLVLRAPWFTSFIVSINSGYLQIDNCIVEDGIICATNPSTVHIKFCTFRHASVILQHLNVSIIENCEFSQSGGANIFIEGHPKDEKNWSYTFLKDRTDAIYHQKRSLHRKKHGLKVTSSLTSTAQSSFTGKSQTTRSSGQCFDTASHDPSFNFDEPGGNFYNSCLPASHYPGHDRDRDGLIGCRDLQSMYQDSFTDNQPVTTAVPLVTTTTTGTQKNENENLKMNHECSNETLSFSNEKELLSQSYNSHNSKYAGGMSENSPASVTVLANQNETLGNNARKKSVGACSLPQVCEENVTLRTEEKRSFNACSSDDEKFAKPGFSLFQDQSNSKNIKHSALKKSDRRKSVDSHVGFQLDENVTSSHTESEILLRGHEKQMSASSYTRSSKIVSPSTETNNSKLPPLPKGAQLKVSNTRRKSTGCVGNQDRSHSNSSQNEHIENTDICDVTKPDTVPVNCSTDQNICDVTKPDTVNCSTDQLFEQQNICIMETNIGLQIQVLEGSFDFKDTEKSMETDKLTMLQSSAISNQRPLDFSVSLSCGSSSNNSTTNTQVNIDTSTNNDGADLVDSLALSGSASIQPSPCGVSNGQEKSENHGVNFQGLEVACSDHPGDSDNHSLAYDVLHSHLIHPIRRSQSDEVLMKSDDDLSILDEIEDSSNETENDAYEVSSQTSDSSDVESTQFSDTDDEFSFSEESVIMLPHLNEFHVNHLESSTSTRGVQAEIVSINSECTKPVPVNILEDTSMSSYVGHVQGCLIYQCRMNHSKGGLMISLQAHAIISECDISNVGYGIRCIQNSRIVILKNKIHHCQTSGIFMRLAATGLIAGNDIHSNNEAGIDIRKSADPLVQFNQIHHGKRSGVVVLSNGHGHIKRNDIYSNTEAGIYVLYGGDPVISENYIYEGRAAGVAVNAGGKGCVLDNVIKGNNWGGIDIRNGSCSLVRGNSIINGISDGVVVGVNGKGSIENNLISGNAGCGIWIMAAANLSIQGNQICNNGHCGVMMRDQPSCETSSMESHLQQFLPDLSHRSFSQCSDGLSLPEPHNIYALLQYNNIYFNKGEGVLIEINKEIRMLYNAIHANQKDGIHMAHNSPAIIEVNSITNNRGSGIVTSAFDKVSLTGNGIYDNEKHGVVCRNICIIEANDIVGHSLYAVLVQGKDQVQITKNRLSSSNLAAVKGEELSVITAANNKIWDRGGGDFSCDGHLNASDNVLIRPNLISRLPGSNEFSKTDFLIDPPQRPQIPPLPPPTSIPSHHVALATRVTAPSSEQKSKLCVIL